MAHVKASIYDSIVSQYELELNRSKIVLGTILDDPLSILTENSDFDLTRVNKQLLKCIENKNKVDFLKDNRNHIIEITGSIVSKQNNTKIKEENTIKNNIIEKRNENFYNVKKEVIDLSKNNKN
tara:strand:- start:310 stop:681 length:372 start_codon:yes stop_codon:yes gene_type:complete